MARLPDAFERDTLQFIALRGWHGFQRHRDIDSVASLSFFATLSLFPAALTAVSAVALFSTRESTVDRIVALLNPVLRSTPDGEIREVLDQLVRIENPGVALGLGIVLTLYAVSSYATAFGRSVNNVYEVQEGRRIWTTRSLNVLVAIFLLLAVGLSLVLLLATPTLTMTLARTARVDPGWAVAVDIVKWPILVALGVLVISVLYWATPNVHLPQHRLVSYGAVLALAAAAVGSAGFVIYVTRISDYSKAYGLLGGGLLAMLWLFIVNLALVIGAEFDAEAVRYYQLRHGMPAETVVQVRMRATGRNLTLARGLAADQARARAIRAEGVAENAARVKHRG